MMQLFIKAVFSLAQVISIYTLSFTDAGGNTVNMSSFQGKKVLLVNIALNSEYANQLTELEQLQQLYKDSLSIIVFPTDDFGNSPQSTEEIQGTLRTTYDAHFIIAQKCNVKTGEAYQTISIYQWLHNAEDNGRVSLTPKGDFHKFLIGSDGMPIGIFKSMVSPMGAEMQNALNR